MTQTNMRVIITFLTPLLLLFVSLRGAETTPGEHVISTIAVELHGGKAFDRAVSDLRECMSQVTGRNFTIGKTAGKPYGAIVLRIATPDLALAKDEYMLHPEGRNYVIEGGTVTGVIWGVYDFLERAANCLWLDRDTTVIPENPSFAFPKTAIRVRPAVYSVEIYTGMKRNSEEDCLLKLRNRENTWNTGLPEASVEFGRPRANHTLGHYAKGWTDPQFFALDRKGNRQKETYCLSNPKLRHAVAEKLKAYIRQDRADGIQAEFYDISQNDTGSGVECVCPACRAILKREGAYSGVLGDFLNAVSAEVRDEFPDVTISTLAYNYTLAPPAHIVFDDKIMVRMCGASLWHPFTVGSHYDKVLRGWKGHAAQTGIWDYAKHYRGLEFPYVYKLDELPAVFRNCKAYNVRHYFFENELPLERSFAQLQWWMMLRLAVDPDRDYNELINKFLAGYYGPKAAPAMREYLDYLMRRQKESGSRKGEDALHTTCCYLDDEFYSVVNRLLDRAEQLAGDNALHARHVRRERIPVDLSFHTLRPATPENQAARTAAFARYAACSIETSDACPRLAEWQKTTTREQMSLYAELEKLLPLPVPEQFKGKTIVDVMWKDFTRYGNQMKSISVDPDGLAGRTWGKPREASGKPFRYPLEFVLTDYTDAEYAKISLTQKELRADGQYHWIDVGSMKLPNMNGLLMGPHFRAMLWKGGVGIVPETWEVWAHMKATGPELGGKANEPNGLFCDRIIFVKHEGR